MKLPGANPSVRRIFAADRATALATTFSVVMLAFGIMARWLSKLPTGPGEWVELDATEIRNVLLLVALLILLLAGAAVLRVRSIRAAFRDGLRLDAQVLQILPFSGGGKRLKLNFELDGQSIETFTDVSKKVRFLEGLAGHSIEIAVHPRKPHKVFLCQAFVDQSEPSLASSR